jgi:hypothetical protein
MGYTKEMILYSADLDYTKYIKELNIRLKDNDYHYLIPLMIPDNYMNNWGDDLYDSYFRYAVTHAFSSLRDLLNSKNVKDYPADLKKKNIEDFILDIKNIFELVESYEDNYIEVNGRIVPIEEYNYEELKEDFYALIETFAALADDVESDRKLIEIWSKALQSESKDLRDLVDNTDLVFKVADNRLFIQDSKDSANRFYSLIPEIIKAERKDKAGRYTNRQAYCYYDSKFRAFLYPIKTGKFDFDIKECLSLYNKLAFDTESYSAFELYLQSCTKQEWKNAIKAANTFVALVNKKLRKGKDYDSFRLDIMLVEAMREQLAHHYLVIRKDVDLVALAKKYKNIAELRSINSYLRELSFENAEPDENEIAEIADIDDLIHKLWGLLKLNNKDTVFTGKTDDNDSNNSSNNNNNSRPQIGKLAYYTALDTLGYLLPQTAKAGEEGILSMMHLAYMNDPNEGKILPKHVFSGTKREVTREVARYPYVFLKSFTRRIDDLPMWEMYGAKAEGVCLVVDPKQFTDKNAHTPMYYVCYLRRVEDKYDIIHEDNLNLSKDTVTEIKGILKDIKDAVEAHSRNTARDKAFLAAIDTAIQEVKFMFKDADYNHERELRIVYLAPTSADTRIKQTQEPETGKDAKPLEYEKGKMPFLYVSDIGPVVIDEIILGPKFIGANKELPFLERRCDQLSQKFKKEYDEKNIKITFSDINYR